jgi:hypothetical protein
VKGWKERLAKLREQKEQEKKTIEETKIEESVSEEVERLKDLVGPTKGLERGKDGKIEVDKEKVEERKEPLVPELDLSSSIEVSDKIEENKKGSSPSKRLTL